MIHNTIPLVNMHIAKEYLRLDDLDGAIDLARTAIDEYGASNTVTLTAPATAVLVEALLRRGADGDLWEAQAAIDRLAAIPTDPGYVVCEIWLLRLRALLAQENGNSGTYRDYRDLYRAMATSLGFEGHMKWAEAMP